MRDSDLGTAQGQVLGWGGWRGRDSPSSRHPGRLLPSTHSKQCCRQALPFLPQHPSDWQQLSNDQPLRLCQPPSLEYFRGKSENDQPPP